MTSGKSAKNARNAREEAQRMIQKNTKGGKKGGAAKWAVIGAVLLALIVLATIVIVGSKKDIDLSNTTPPANAVEGIGFEQKSEPVENAPEVDIYVDFQCPACQQFEAENGETLKGMAENGEIVLEHRPIAILDHTTSTNYASRAGNAFACVLDAKPENAQDFFDKLFEIQPPEGGAGLPNADLISAASSVGATGVDDCIKDGQFRGWIKDVTDKAVDAEVTSTPTIVINGEQWNREGNLYDAIEAAKTGEAPAEATATMTPGN